MKKYHVFLTITGVLSMLLSSCSGNGDVNTEGPTGESSEPLVHEHAWGSPTYEWAADYSSCTVQRVCLTDSEHIEKETVTSTYDVISEPRCETDGLGRYTVTFENEAFSNQTHDEIIDAIEHNYVFDSIVWTGFAAQAKYVCSHDPHHTQYHDATVTSAATTSPLCESSGIRTYTATYDGHSDTKTEVLSPLGHNWGSTTYAWTSDYSSCTATRVCKYDSSHIETETVDSIYVETIPPTYEADGEGTYTATFTNEAFETQVVNITIDQLVRYNGEFPVLSDDGETITYGLYPQTNVNDSTLVSALNELTTPESNGWYLYNGEYYAKTSATPYFSSYKFDNGITIVKETTYWFKCEPIVWNVLSSTSGVYSVVSSVLLDAHCFYGSLYNRTIGSNTIFPNNYEYSDIRTWLNNDFYDAAFTLDDSNIQITTVDNSKSTTDSKYNSYACNNTQDKVFLLSYKDYLTTSYGFSSSTDVDSSRKCRTTDWARARGAWYQDSGQYLFNGYYITRSPYSGNQKTVWWVDYNGTFYSSGSADSKPFSIRPGISITLA